VAQFDLAGVPPLDLRSEPHARPASAEVEDGTGHVGTPVHMLADGIAMNEPQDPNNVVRVDEVVDEHWSFPGRMASRECRLPVSHGVVGRFGARASQLVWAHARPYDLAQLCLATAARREKRRPRRPSARS
jgi:hypothetical protein